MGGWLAWIFAATRGGTEAADEVKAREGTEFAGTAWPMKRGRSQDDGMFDEDEHISMINRFLRPPNPKTFRELLQHFCLRDVEAFMPVISRRTLMVSDSEPRTQWVFCGSERGGANYPQFWHFAPSRLERWNQGSRVRAIFDQTL